MRIWDLPVKNLCRQHLLGEHRELHCIWTFLTTNKGGSYRKHPETLRWKGKLAALKMRHEWQVMEMKKRGWNHNSPIAFDVQDTDYIGQTDFINTLDEQVAILRAKGCDCKV